MSSSSPYEHVREMKRMNRLDRCRLVLCFSLDDLNDIIWSAAYHGDTGIVRDILNCLLEDNRSDDTINTLLSGRTPPRIIPPPSPSREDIEQGRVFTSLTTSAAEGAIYGEKRETLRYILRYYNPDTVDYLIIYAEHFGRRNMADMIYTWSLRSYYSRYI